MYNYDWTAENGIFRLNISGKYNNEIRPVYKQELDFFGFNEFWDYPETDKPLLWAENVRRYVLNGELVAEAQGGGFYTKPAIKIHKKGIKLSPIDTDRLYEVNKDLMFGLEQTATSFIRKQYERFKKQNYQFVCAFSGGKDSLVLLDLVNKALSPDEYYVIFGDTGMELSCTYSAVEKAKVLYPQIKFHTASCDMTAEESWDKFGPPGRRMRWCCAVHKSVPTILKLRELTGDYNARAVVYDGVRAEESAQRAEYDEVSIGAKNTNQINCSPILRWNSAEVFVYVLGKGIFLNEAYKVGLSRVGCNICPMGTGWRDYIANAVFFDDVNPFLSRVEKYVEAIRPANGLKNYVEAGGWKARMGGRGLPSGGNRITEIIEDDSLKFLFSRKTNEWNNIAPILGKIIKRTKNGFIQMIGNKTVNCEIGVSNNGSEYVIYSPYSLLDRFDVSRLRGVANKAAYCCGCKACAVQCPTGAYIINDDKSIYIREASCIQCGKCIAFCGKGCLVARSLSVTGGNCMELSGINRYQTFGFRKAFLQHFFDQKSECFASKQLGNRQYDALKVWLREAGLLETANKGEKVGQPTALFRKLEEKGLSADDYLTWAVIWTNLAYNSKIVKWYMLFAQTGQSYEKGDLVFMLGDEFSESTRDNAVTALLETFRESPIGSALKQGIPVKLGNIQKYSKVGWETPDSIAILYALYRFAEETGFYSFSLSQLAEMRKSSDSKGMDPIAIYGISSDDFIGILKELAVHYPQYISVAFQAGLDSIRLYNNFKSVDILNLIHIGGNN